MEFEHFLESGETGLSEGSIYERLRRHPGIEFDPYLAHAALIYDPQSAQILESVHREYIEVAQRHKRAMFVLTDTWRANQERIRRSRFHAHPVNQDNVVFLRKLRESYEPSVKPIFIGGQIGPRGDAYKPEEALPSGEAERFHRAQLDALASAGVDFLYAATLPALPEAIGIARVMARLSLPYILSFIIRGNGTLLDGVSLAYAIRLIDDSTPKPPSGYAINCVHPTVFSAGMGALEMHSPAMSKRILSFQANTSAMDPSKLDGLEELDSEEPGVLAGQMLAAQQRFHTQFMGGCCGTDTSHIEALASGYNKTLD